jgi:ankyrin repeat protein
MDEILGIENDLLAAITSGDLNACVALLRAGADVDAADRDGSTALMHADRYGQTAIRSLLLTHGANVDARERHGYSALMTAASFGRDESCRAFLDAGARVDITSSAGEQALAIAARSGHLSTCSLLLAAGAAIDAANAYLESALTAASRAGHLDVCKLLLESGAEIDEVALEAAATGSEDIFSSLMDRAPELDEGKLSAVLLAAAGAGARTNCDRLLEAKAPASLDALLDAAAAGHIGVCELLISHGAPVNSAEGGALAPLHAATRSGSVSLCEFLLKAGAEVDGVGSRPGWTALYEAIDWGAAGALDVCRLLIEGGAEVAPVRKHKGDRSPFQLAVMRGRLDIVRFFVEELGEDLQQRTVDGLGLEDLGRKHPEVVHFLHSIATERAVDAELSRENPSQRVVRGATSLGPL